MGAGRQRQERCGARKPPDLGQGRARALKGATLALICERPGHGYDLANRLRRRLGPTWRIIAKDLYPILDQMEQAGLVRRVEKPSAGRPRQKTVVYHPTDRAGEALDRWMDSGVRKEPLRPDVWSRLASSRPGDVKRLIRILDDYEDDLLRLIEEAHDEDPLPLRSWATLMLDITRSGVDRQLQSELAWIVDSRRRILEFDAASRSH